MVARPDAASAPRCDAPSRGTSLVRNSPPLGPYSRTMPVYTIFFKLYHSGAQFFQGSVDTFWIPEMRKLHSSGGKAMSSHFFLAVLRSVKRVWGLKY